MGLKEIIKPSVTKLKTFVTVYIDDKEIDIPAESEGLILCNINSYAGGTMELWPSSDEDDGRAWRSSSYQDGLFELVSVSGSAELAKIQIGLASCTKIGQGLVFDLLYYLYSS